MIQLQKEIPSTKNVYRQNSTAILFSCSAKPPTRQQLNNLRKDFIRVADKDSANNPVEYERRKGICPLTGHCAGVANYIQKKYGGVAVRGVIKIRINGEQKNGSPLLE
jgi:hypothetical protein